MKTLLLILFYFIILNGCSERNPFESERILSWGMEFGMIDTINLVAENEYMIYYPEVIFSKERLLISTYSTISQNGLLFNYKILKKISNQEYLVELIQKGESKKRKVHIFLDNLENGVDHNKCHEMFIIGDGIKIYIWACPNGISYLENTSNRDIKLDGKMGKP